MAAYAIERLTGPDAYDRVEPVMHEYLLYIAARFTDDLGVRFDDLDGFIAGRHRAIRDELPNLVAGRGRLLAVRRAAGEVVGAGALKPVDDTTAEIKRMYIRPVARGNGLGRALLGRLLADARAEGFRTLRLETLALLTEAMELYRSFGFTEVPGFEGSEVEAAGADRNARYLERHEPLTDIRS